MVYDESLEGFSIVTIPQFSEDKVFHLPSIGFTAGMRAVWRLYKQGRWEDLEDLGVIREVAEPKALLVGYGDTLSYRQARRVKKLVPEFAEASKELRTAYVLLFIEEKELMKTSTTTIYHAEVPAPTSLESRTKAVDTAEKYRAIIERDGGKIEAGRRFHEEEGHSMLMVTLVKGKPETYLPDFTWKKVTQGETIEIPEDAQEIPGDGE